MIEDEDMGVGGNEEMAAARYSPCITMMIDNIGGRKTRLYTARYALLMPPLQRQTERTRYDLAF